MVLTLLLLAGSLGLGSAPVSARYLPSEPTGTAVASDPSGTASVLGEVTEERSTYSRQFQLSDGSRRLEVFLHPINYRDPQGVWQPIDAQLSVSKSL